jgi:hypothetical protein
MKRWPSVDFSRCWQGHEHRVAEHPPRGYSIVSLEREKAKDKVCQPGRKAEIY